MPVFEIATRALVVAFKADGKTNREITMITGIEKRTINSIYARAIERGFDPAMRPLKLENKHIEDAHRSGRPSKQEQAKEKVGSQSSLSGTQESRIEEDKANKETWIDEQDEEVWMDEEDKDGEASVVP